MEGWRTARNTWMTGREHSREMRGREKAREGTHKSESENIEAWKVGQRRRKRNREETARYSEPLLGMINQLNWAELTSRGLVCKFSSCPNNPQHARVHAHTYRHTHVRAHTHSLTQAYTQKQVLNAPHAPQLLIWKLENYRLISLCSLIPIKNQKLQCYVECFLMQKVLKTRGAWTYYKIS